MANFATQKAWQNKEHRGIKNPVKHLGWSIFHSILDVSQGSECATEESYITLKYFTKSKFLSFEESHFLFASQLRVLMLELERQAEKEILVGEKSRL